MSDADAIRAAVRGAGFNGAIRSVRPLSGGCIHNVSRIDLSTGESLVAKTGPEDVLAQFREEMTGLAAIVRTETVIAPRPFTATCVNGVSVLLISHVEPGPASDSSWAQFGRDLAALHAADAGDQYGFEIGNHLGSTPQPNQWNDDWVEFNRKQRFGHQLALAELKSLLRPEESRAITRVIERMHELIPRRPKPSLLHGDLWSGNALPTVGDRVAVIDPAPYVGDGWADIAMMRLFGGFSQSCFDAYAAAQSDHENLQTRIAVYQLYHVLNHVNIFGRGYAGQAMALAGRLGA